MINLITLQPQFVFKYRLKVFLDLHLIRIRYTFDVSCSPDPSPERINKAYAFNYTLWLGQIPTKIEQKLIVAPSVLM